MSGRLSPFTIIAECAAVYGASKLGFIEDFKDISIDEVTPMNVGHGDQPVHT